MRRFSLNVAIIRPITATSAAHASAIAIGLSRAP
jgi:hypothetical protein